jgi:hypothetical protein
MASRPTWKGRTMEDKAEIVATILLAFSTICSAWCVYEATRWSGVQSIELAKANANRSESVRLSNIALSYAEIDVQLWTQWVTAVSKNDTSLADFLRERFRPEFTPAFETWLNLSSDGSIPPGTPFDLPEYRLTAFSQSKEYLDTALNSTQAAQVANQIGDNYILTTVLFASVLFLAGIQSKLKDIKLRRWLLILAIGLFAVAFGILVTLPVSVGF